MPDVSVALLGSIPRAVEGAASLGPSVIPGFAPETSSINYKVGLYEGPHPKPTIGPLFQQDHPLGGSSDADLYGSPPHNLSPPRGSDHSKSSQVDVDHDQQPIRKFDTSTLLYVIPEVRRHYDLHAVAWG